MNRVRIASLVLVSGVALVLCGFQAVAAPHRGGEETGEALETALSRFDEAQKGIRTLRAEFTETTVSQLLKEPQVAKGHFYMNKPDSVLWEYTSPEVMRFLIARGEYVGYFPTRKRAERRNIRRWKDQIFRFFGLGQVSTELRKFYHIRLDKPSSEMEGTVLLVLDPKKRRLKKRMDSVRFWLDASTSLPLQVEYRSSAGNTRLIRFHRLRVNEDLSASLFRVDIPSDVTVTTGFSGLGAPPQDSSQN